MRDMVSQGFLCECMHINEYVYSCNEKTKMKVSGVNIIRTAIPLHVTCIRQPKLYTSTNAWMYMKGLGIAKKQNSNVELGIDIASCNLMNSSGKYYTLTTYLVELSYSDHCIK